VSEFNECMDRACGMHGGEVNSVHNFGGRKLKDRPFGRPRHMWKVNVKMDLMRRIEGACVGFFWHRIWREAVITFRLHEGICCTA
jgi:hypothetical protein